MGLPSANSPAVSLPQAVDPDVRRAVVRCELERLLTSPSLRDSDHLKRFLRYIVEHTLAGEGDGLKEYRLGVEVFDRDASFDPKIDPVVRMTARRLRAKLKEHYENGGLGATVPEAAQHGELGEGQPGLAPQLGLEPVGEQAGPQVRSQDLAHLGAETSLALDHCHEVNGTHRVRQAPPRGRGVRRPLASHALRP